MKKKTGGSGVAEVALQLTVTPQPSPEPLGTARQCFMVLLRQGGFFFLKQGPCSKGMWLNRVPKIHVYLGL